MPHTRELKPRRGGGGETLAFEIEEKREEVTLSTRLSGPRKKESREPRIWRTK